jgi:hypothetical protein
MSSLLTLATVTALVVQAPTTLYRTEMIQAAPGRLLELIDAVTGELPAYTAAGEERPFIIRHSQGDRWDLMVLVPMGADASTYFAAPRAAKREAAGLSGAAHDARWRGLVAWREELYVHGPAVVDLRREFDAAGLAHIEIFQALAGHHDELRTERLMEAAFNEYVGRTRLLLFERDPALGGAAWDMFTIDLYRDLRHYAEVSSFSAEAGDAAARRAGFTGTAAIGPTLRQHISLHHDTIGTVVK